MKTISRYIMTLALLITAATGAWAQEETLLTTIESTANTTFTSGSQSFDGVATVTFSQSVNNNGDGWGWFRGNETTITVTAANNDVTITKVKFYCSEGSAFDEEAPFEAIVKYEVSDNIAIVNGTSIGRYGVTKIEVYGYVTPSAPAVEVTTNAAEEGATFTEASFQMPAFDATADYELVRDMSIQMQAQVGDGNDGVRYRVKKDGNNKFIPADMEITAVPALFTVNDAIEQKALTQTQDYIVEIYAIDAEGQPTGEPMTFATFTFEPGIYAVKAVAAQGSDYDGETALSNTFKLFQGYEVQVAAKEFITYYKDEPLYVEDEAAELYTIASITESEAVLSSEISVAPALTPLLVFNSSDEAKTFLLIPTTDKTPDNVTAATQFVGTLEATTIPASTTGADNYALNGYAFVWVKTAIEVGANKCWLHIASQPAGARGNTRSITGGNGTTGIDAIENVTIDNEGWYDLNGRKLQSAPNRKGIYIHNGKKVVMK